MLQAFMHGTGLAASVNSAFGEPELLDDLLDHWSADIHKEEKVALLHMLQVGEGKRCTQLLCVGFDSDERDKMRLVHAAAGAVTLCTSITLRPSLFWKLVLA